MRNLICLILCGLIIHLGVDAQNNEVGLNISKTFFFGDLGALNGTNIPIIENMTLSNADVSVGFFHRLYFSEYVNIKTSLSIGKLSGDDALVKAGEVGSKSWLRNYRNLNFRSNILEFSAVAEYNILGYRIGDKSQRFTPYISAGIGVVKFNPKAEFNGEWVELQPLGTEGQGMVVTGVKPPYVKIQPLIPISAGIKYNLTGALALGLEFSYKLTFTDFIDDVSGVYIDPDQFHDTYTYDEANYVYQLSRRSMEIDPTDTYGAYTAPGQERGNPKNNDNYMYIGLNLSMKVHKQSLHCISSWYK